jgi:hypothetical protein
MRKVSVFVAVVLLLAASEIRAQRAPVSGSLGRFSESLIEVPPGPSISRGRFYVPAYSSLLARDAKTSLDLSVTLSIHNISERGILVIERIEYFNVAGKSVDKFLPHPIALKPYGAIQLVVPEADIRGGLGSNFVVDWSSPETIDDPIVEAVMIGGPGTQGYSFVSVGRKVSRP